MNSQQRSRIKRQIQGYLEKHPQAELRQVREWLLEGNQVVDLTEMNPATLKSFIFYQIKKFHGGLDVTKHAGNNGRPQIAGRKQGQIRRLMINKEHRGIRTVASRVGVSYQTVANVMKKSGAKPYHKYRAQKLSQAHKERRVTFSKWMLKNFGSPRAGRNLGLLINTDCSAKIRVNPTRNSKKSQQKCETLAQLKRAIIGAWRSINEDRALVVKLMSSIPVRCRAVVESGGNQVH